MVLERIKSVLGKRPKPPKASTGSSRLVSKYQIPRFQVEDLGTLPQDHRRILEDFKKAKLLPYTYCTVEMPESFKKIIQKLSPSKEMKAFWAQPIPDVHDEKNLKVILEDWLAVFDQWFFLGSLRPAVDIVIIDDASASLRGKHIEQNLKTRILINKSDKFPRPSNISLAQDLVAVLLHEMLHTFIDMYRCRQACCNDTSQFFHPASGGTGSDGHGPAFADSFCLLKDALEIAVDHQWRVDPRHLLPSIANSMFFDGWQPSFEQLTRYGMNPEAWGDPEKWVPRAEVHFGPYQSRQES